jgi:AcrR family transcriptional regulator
MSPSVRMSAEDRRELVIEAAMIEFGLGGFDGTSTEAIARRVGVSQPYLFRLFPTKKALFLACVERCFQRIHAMWVQAAGDTTGEESLIAMGAAYAGLIEDRAVLQLQLQMWATACQDDEVREVARRGMSGLWVAAQRISGSDDQRVMQFMAGGMLLNVMAAMDLPRIKATLGESLTGLASAMTGSAKPA